MNIENINGLFLYKNYISDEYHNDLINFINDQPWNVSLSRRTQHYGYIYDYSKKSKPQSTIAIPEIFLQLKTNIESLPMINNIKFDQCIINEYFPGQGISPHVDHTTQFGPIVVSLSLASPCTFQFIRNNMVLNYKLEPKELCIMTEDARYFYKHSIPKTKSDRTGIRYSITFRSIKD